MANVAHASLTGTDLHEPKGISTATSGQTYIANGAGSGTWTTVAGLSITGMIADFVTPIAPTGWLECDGSDVSITTYSALYAAMTIQTVGNRTNGSTTVAVSSSTGMKPGYYVFATGIASGTTIFSVDSPTQITLSTNATSTTSGNIVVSPWLLNTGTIRLPNTTTSGRYRRSRTSIKQMGLSQADTFKFHTHSGTADSGGAHTHGITDTGHTHSIPNSSASLISSGASFAVSPTYVSTTPGTTGNSGTGISINSGGAHTHNLTIDAQGGDADTNETRPLTLIVMTCVKT